MTVQFGQQAVETKTWETMDKYSWPLLCVGRSEISSQPCPMLEEDSHRLPTLKLDPMRENIEIGRMVCPQTDDCQTSNKASDVDYGSFDLFHCLGQDQEGLPCFSRPATCRL